MKQLCIASTTAAWVALGAFASTEAQALGFFNNGTGLGSPASTLTFSEHGPLTTATPLTNKFADLGVSFAGAYENPDMSVYSHMEGDRIGNFVQNSNLTQPLTLQFSTVLDEVAFAMVTAPGTSTFTAYLQGQKVLDARYASGNLASNFYGLSGVLFDRLTIEVASSDRALMLDQLQLGAPVPEPSTWALLTAGLLVAASSARHRRP